MRREIAGLAVFLAAGMWVSPAFAVEKPDMPSQYVITIKSVQLKNNTGQWITVIEPDRQVDLVTTEPSVSFFNNAGRVPPGNYINFKVEILETIKLAGKLRGIEMTKEGGEVTIGGTAESAEELPGTFTSVEETAPTWNDKAEGVVRVHLNLNHEDENDVISIHAKRDLVPALEVKKGSFIRVWFDLDLKNTLKYAGAGDLGPGLPKGRIMYCLTPSQVDGASVTVDEETIDVPSNNLALDF